MPACEISNLDGRENKSTQVTVESSKKTTMGKFKLWLAYLVSTQPLLTANRVKSKSLALSQAPTLMADDAHCHCHSHSHAYLQGDLVASHSHSHGYSEANKAHFNHNKAETYDKRPDTIELSRRQSNAMIKAYPFDESKTTVMDFACGTGECLWCLWMSWTRKPLPGLISRGLAPHANRIVGVDISEAMVKYNPYWATLFKEWQLSFSFVGQSIQPTRRKSRHPTWRDASYLYWT
jgi:hypothetical protein